MSGPIGGYAHPIPPRRKRRGLISGHRHSASDSEPEKLAETEAIIAGEDPREQLAEPFAKAVAENEKAAAPPTPEKSQ